MLTALPMLLTAVAVQFMPDSVPAHYNFEGEIDRWGSKYENFIMPDFIVLMTVFFLLFIRGMGRRSKRADIDDKQRGEAAANAKVLYYVAIAMVVFETVLHCVMMYSDFAVADGKAVMPGVDIYKISGVIIGVFVVAAGNVIPKAKRNRLIGVRTKWSLADDETWAASNRFGGGLMVVAGLLIIVESLMVKGIASVLAATAILLVCVVIVVIYSYKVYTKRNTNRDEE